MIRVIISNRILVEEDCFRLNKRYAMLPLVLAVLPLVPFEPDITHMYIVRILLCNVNEDEILEEEILDYRIGR